MFCFAVGAKALFPSLARVLFQKYLADRGVLRFVSLSWSVKFRRPFVLQPFATRLQNVERPKAAQSSFLAFGEDARLRLFPNGVAVT